MRSILHTLPIRWQITVLHAAILALVLAGGGLMVWKTQAQFQYDSLLARHRSEAQAIISGALPAKFTAILYPVARPDTAKLKALQAKIVAALDPPGTSAAALQKNIALLNPKFAAKIFGPEENAPPAAELQAMLFKMMPDLFPPDEDPAETRKKLMTLDPTLAAELFPESPLDLQVLQKAAADLAQNLGAKDRRAVILAPDGSVLAQSVVGPACPPPNKPLADAADSFYAKLYAARSFDKIGDGSAELMLPVLWQSDQARPAALAWLCMSTDSIDTNLRQLGASLAIGWVLVVGLATLLGVTATRRVLQPLDRVVATTRAISAGDLRQRVGLPPGRTELAQLSTAFDTMVARLEASFAAQRRFVADAAHELRTPLTALSASTELLLIGAAENDHATMQRLLRHLDGELSRVIRLTNDLLTLSQLDARPQIDLRPTDLSSVLAEVGEHSRDLLRGQALDLDIAPGLCVRGDPDRLRQIVLNLLDNARKYTPAGGTIALRAYAEHRAPTTDQRLLATNLDQEAQRCGDTDSADPSAISVPSSAIARSSPAGRRSSIVVEIEDTGVGMPADALPHLFERFYRVDSARARASGGSGLGLPIVQALVWAHDGQIDIQSAPNQGTCVTIWLPLETQAASPVRQLELRPDSEEYMS